MIKEQRSVNIKMEEDVATTIDEVVITGTGAQRKLVQTGAITTVDMEHLMANPSSSVVNALAGNVAGVLAPPDFRSTRTKCFRILDSRYFHIWGWNRCLYFGGWIRT